MKKKPVWRLMNHLLRVISWNFLIQAKKCGEWGSLFFSFSFVFFYVCAKKIGTINWPNLWLGLYGLFGSLSGVYHSYVDRFGLDRNVVFPTHNQSAVSTHMHAVSLNSHFSLISSKSCITITQYYSFLALIFDLLTSGWTRLPTGW